MDIVICMCLWAIGGYTVFTQQLHNTDPFFTTRPLFQQQQARPTLSGDKQRIPESDSLTRSVKQPLSEVNQRFGPVNPPAVPPPAPPPPPPPPPPVAPLVLSAISQNDLSKFKYRIPAVNKPGPEDPVIGPKDPVKKPLDTAIAPKDPVTKPLDTGLGPEDPVTKPLDTGLGPKDPVTKPLDTGLGPKNQVKKPLDTGLEPNDPVTNPPDTRLGPKDPVKTPLDTGLGPKGAQIPIPPAVEKRCPEYRSLYRRDRLILLYQEDRCEMEVRLRRDKQTRGETTSVRFRRHRQSKQDRQRASRTQGQKVVCDELPVTEVAGTKSIITRPDECKL
ncbi:hypothetical protein KP79_PYT21904 [Mizuhopecten yessoensis]|uniref:Uncharacterized protein n=2 Tax=Mizuhopecten yessoensis TaxID=6573 RepID=A0A210PRD6_MIZYE|nr:hypothetical protein KP79_PYT21904 [Mizuhopecten yessoensis]